MAKSNLLWQASDYQEIVHWDVVKAQEKADTFNQYLGEFAIILVRAKVDKNGKVIPELDDKGHTIINRGRKNPFNIH